MAHQTTLYFCLRLLRLILSALSLPLGLLYYLQNGTALSTPVVVGAVFLVFLPWSMLFVALSEETYTGSTKSLALALIASLAGFSYTLIVYPSGWKYSFYAWLLASFIAIAIGFAIFFLYTLPKNARGKKILPWWGMVLAGACFIFLLYFIARFAMPLAEKFTNTDLSIFQKIVGFSIFGSQILGIGGGAFRLLTTATPETIFDTSSQNERYRSIVVVVSIVVVATAVGVLLFSVT